MKQIVIFAVPQAHTLENVLADNKGAKLIDALERKVDAEWPPSWFLPGFGRVYGGKRLVMMRIRDGVTPNQIQQELDDNAIPWIVVGGYGHKKEIIRRLNGTAVLKDGLPKQVRKVFIAAAKSDLLRFKDLNSDGSTPTSLGSIHRWDGDEEVDGDIEIETLSDVIVPNDTPDEIQQSVKGTARVKISK